VSPIDGGVPFCLEDGDDECLRGGGEKEEDRQREGGQGRRGDEGEERSRRKERDVHIRAQCIMVAMPNNQLLPAPPPIHRLK